MNKLSSANRPRIELAEFLRHHRERLAPEDVGLSSGRRRRTPGLRREEVATLAGVGLTWYTWLEQGRDIKASATFLDSLSRVFSLDAMERRHLYLLAHQRLPLEQGETWCSVPGVIGRLLHDLVERPAYVLNLRWDVLKWNDAAEQIFHFSEQPLEHRNLLWMLFTDPRTRSTFHNWEEQTPKILSSFRRDYARATHAPDIESLVKELEKIAPDFKNWWHQPTVNALCQGTRSLFIEKVGIVDFEHATLIFDEDRHLRLIYYAPIIPVS